MSRESERITVVELHKTGMRTADIVRTTGFKQRTVYKIVRRYKETGGTSDRPRSGRPTTATTPENINKPMRTLMNQPMQLTQRRQGDEQPRRRIASIRYLSPRVNEAHNGSLKLILSFVVALIRADQCAPSWSSSDQVCVMPPHHLG
ncbi:unnamed protein product [Heligmosomoides polygyrus]|uniref:Helix-turn-helix domain-containing protein n=1 Tax=Heligmosomoides polygyrus TaxID=6339 RepID=A0A183FGN9_HELPZ|nr:unnamed protein product [Heligmosomoides polygyrus]